MQVGTDWWNGRTGDDGKLGLDPAPPGLMKFFTWPADLATQQQRHTAMAAGQQISARKILLGEHAIPANKRSDEVTFRLPR